MLPPLQRWVALVDHHSCGPQVLSFLDSSGFRAVLRDCCPQIQALPAEELLRRYRNEARVAELAHAARRVHEVVPLFSEAMEIRKGPGFPSPRVTVKEVSWAGLTWVHHSAG